MAKYSVALMIYGDGLSEKNALTHDMYKDLAAAFIADGCIVKSVLYCDAAAPALATSLLEFDAVLVWVNPIEQGVDRTVLDALLTEIASTGRLVATHPEVILEIGTKEILYKTKDMSWGSDTLAYHTFEDFCNRFSASLYAGGTRILKQYRGDGGNGGFKIIHHATTDTITILPAPSSSVARTVSYDELCREMKPYFTKGRLLIDQAWNANIVNGVVRCYLSGAKVAGFGYQEVNALYPSNENPALVALRPSQRFYFSENCGLFRDLKEVAEKTWVPELQQRLHIPTHRLPVLWDADLFINRPNDKYTDGKYTLCEINVSCVSPFPPSAIKYIVAEVTDRLGHKLL